MPPKKTPITVPSSGGFEELTGAFAEGGVIAYPTETFYGLAVNPFDEDAVKELFALKTRPPEKPVTLIIGDISMLDAVAGEVPSAARVLMKKFWPGPLTIIFKAKGLPSILTAGTGTVGVRLSGLDAARRLSVELLSPITATSANPSSAPPAKSPSKVIEYFGGGIAALVDGGELAESLPSTIVDACGDKVKIVREGKIPAFEIIDYLSKEGL